MLFRFCVPSYVGRLPFFTIADCAIRLHYFPGYTSQSAFYAKMRAGIAAIAKQKVNGRSLLDLVRQTGTYCSLTLFVTVRRIRSSVFACIGCYWLEIAS